jgi:hypothetical protein
LWMAHTCCLIKYLIVKIMEIGMFILPNILFGYFFLFSVHPFATMKKVQPDSSTTKTCYGIFFVSELGGNRLSFVPKQTSIHSEAVHRCVVGESKCSFSWKQISYNLEENPYVV